MDARSWRFVDAEFGLTAQMLLGEVADAIDRLELIRSELAAQRSGITQG